MYFDINYYIVNLHQGNLASYFSIYNATHYNNINQKMCSSSVKYVIFNLRLMALNPTINIMNQSSVKSTNVVFQELVSSKLYLDLVLL